MGLHEQDKLNIHTIKLFRSVVIMIVGTDNLFGHT